MPHWSDTAAVPYDEYIHSCESATPRRSQKNQIEKKQNKTNKTNTHNAKAHSVGHSLRINEGWPAASKKK